MDTVTLTVVPNELEAEELCGLLRVNGIACMFRRSGLAGAWSTLLASGGRTEVLVYEQDL